MSTFEALYQSPLQQPYLLWAAAAAGLAAVAAGRGRSRSVRAFCLGFGLLPFVDAWLTADAVLGIGALGSGAATFFGSFFAVVGDLRVFLFLEAATADGRIAVGAGKLGRATAWSIVVPVATAAARALMPQGLWLGRATFLFYEVGFLLVLAVRTRLVPSVAPGWTARVVRYVVAYYVLWALADALLLFFALDAAFLLRIAANVLYYGGLLVVIERAAPALRAQPSA